MGGANTDLMQPIALVWSRVFSDTAAPCSEDRNELFGELLREILSRRCRFRKHWPERAVDKAEELTEVLGVVSARCHQDIGDATRVPGHSSKHTHQGAQCVTYRELSWRILFFISRTVCVWWKDSFFSQSRRLHQQLPMCLRQFPCTLLTVSTLR